MKMLIQDWFSKLHLQYDKFLGHTPMDNYAMLYSVTEVTMLEFQLRRRLTKAEDDSIHKCYAYKKGHQDCDHIEHLEQVLRDYNEDKL